MNNVKKRLFGLPTIIVAIGAITSISNLSGKSSSSFPEYSFFVFYGVDNTDLNNCELWQGDFFEPTACEGNQTACYVVMSTPISKMEFDLFIQDVITLNDLYFQLSLSPYGFIIYRRSI